MPPEIVGVNLRDDERHLGVHAIGARVIDHEAAVALCDWRVETRSLARRGEEDDVVFGSEALLGGLFDRDRFAAELHRLSGRTRRGEQAQALDRDFALLEQFQELAADNAGAADHGDVVGVQGAHSEWKGTGYGSGREAVGSRTGRSKCDSRWR